MGYQRKPNYHFSDKNATGIDKVPEGRVVIIDDYEGDGSKQVKQFIKRKNDGITTTTTIQNAVESSGGVGLSSEYNVKSNTMTKAQFEANAEQRRQTYAGSGFIEWGGRYEHPLRSTNTGLWFMGTDHHLATRLSIGRAVSSSTVDGGYPLLNVNGALIFNSLGEGNIYFPEAPKGSKPAAADITAAERKANFFFISDSTDVSNEPKANAKYKVGDRVLHTNDMYECIADDTSGDHLLTNNTYYSKMSIPILSRQDLVFLETWHELVDEKDIVYPFGNCQYTGINTDGLSGIADGAFTGADTYSLFGNWQEANDLVGKGYIWSNLSEAQKVKIVSNPENNIYLSEDGYVQVRYRIRVIEGLNNKTIMNDNWNRSRGASALNYTGANTYIKYRGKSVSVQDINSEDDGTLIYTGSNNRGSEKGLFQGYHSSNTDMNYVTALPIALVQRRNQGGFHPTFNSKGSRCWHYGNGAGANKWYLDGVDTPATDISSCFSGSSLYGGAIATNHSGRVDALYYDEINEKDVNDLRMSANKITDKQHFLNEQFNNLVMSKIRGLDDTVETKYCGVFKTNGPTNVWNRELLLEDGSSAHEHLMDLGFLPYQSFILVSTVDGNIAYCHYNNNGHYVQQELNVKEFPNSVHNTTTISEFSHLFMVQGKERDYSSYNLLQNNTVLACDIIGDPSNYTAEMKALGYSGYPLLRGEDGKTYLEMALEDGKGFGLSGTLDAYDYNNYGIKLSRKVDTIRLCLVLRNGVWASYTRENSLSLNTDDSQETFGYDVVENRLAFHKNILEVDNGLVICFYDTVANPMVPSDNGVPEAVGDIMSTIEYDSYNRQTSKLSSHLLNKITTGNTGHGDYRLGIPLDNSNIEPGASFITHPYGGGMNHSDITSGLTLGDYVGFKTLPYLSKGATRVNLNLLFKEMICDITWGDDYQFRPISDVSRMDDDNGHSVLYGNKVVKTQYFID